MTCVQVKSMLSAYIDGVTTGKQMFSLGQHLQNCNACGEHYESLRRTQALLSRVGRAKAPQDLSLKVRLALSHEAARRREPAWGNVRLRFDNVLRAFMFAISSPRCRICCMISRRWCQSGVWANSARSWAILAWRLYISRWRSARR